MGESRDIIGHLEYNKAAVVTGESSVHCDDANLGLKGKLGSAPLFEVNTSEDIYNKLIAPGLALYKKTGPKKR